MGIENFKIRPTKNHGKNRDRGWVRGNGRSVVENGYNREITRIAVAVCFLKKKFTTTPATGYYIDDENIQVVGMVYALEPL